MPLALQNFKPRLPPAISAVWLNQVDALLTTVFQQAGTSTAAQEALFDGAPLPIGFGGTGAEDAPQALANLGGLNATQIEALIAAALVGLPINYPVTPVEETAGVTVYQQVYPPLTVDRYLNKAAFGYSPGVTDVTYAFNAAHKVSLVNGGIITWDQTVPHKVTNVIDFSFTGTGNQPGVIVQGPAPTVDAALINLLASHTGEAIFNCVGRDAITFKDVSATTDPANFPRTGILSARNVNGGSLQFKGERVTLIGAFSVANMYLYASENSRLRDCYFLQSNGPATRVYTGSNLFSVPSTCAPIFVGNDSCIDHDDEGCEDYNETGGATTDNVIFDISSGYKKRGGWGLCANPNTKVNGRSLFRIATVNGPSNDVSVEGMTGEYTDVGVATLGTITGGSGYSSAGSPYAGVALTGGNGQGAIATITVAGGAVTAVVITTPGDRYFVGDVLSAPASAIGGTGTGFSVPVATVNGARQLNGFFIDNSTAATCSKLKFSATKMPNMTSFLSSSALPIVDDLSIDCCDEQSGGGISIATLQNSPSMRYGAMIVAVSVSKNNAYTGYLERLTRGSNLDDSITDTGSVYKTWTPVASTGFTGVPVFTNITCEIAGNRCRLSAVATLSTGGGWSCTAGALLTGIPFPALARGAVWVIDTTTTALVGLGQVAGADILMPAVSMTTDAILIQADFQIFS